MEEGGEEGGEEEGGSRGRGGKEGEGEGGKTFRVISPCMITGVLLLVQYFVFFGVLM